MNADISTKFVIEKTQKSRLSEVDFENLLFGRVFTDHMFECDFMDGKWKNPTIRPYQPILLEPSAKVFHYGQAVFEGMKAYKDENNAIFLFRPDQNQERINKSSVRLAMPEFPKEWFFEALNRMLILDQDWIKKGIGNVVYIRPFVFATEPAILASPSKNYKFMIILSPVKAYFTGEVSVVIAQQYSRSANGGVGAAKAAGNYAGQFFPTAIAAEQGYQQVVWTDACTHEYLEEAGTMNVFFRINDTLLTAPVSDRILDGVTRKSIIEIAESNGIPVEVRKVSVHELVEAAKNGTLKEMFGAGTAAVVSPIKSFAFDGVDYPVNTPEKTYAAILKTQIQDIQYNLSSDPYGWRYLVSEDNY